MARDIITENYEYFEKNFESLYARYKNMYVVLKDCSVIGFYGAIDDAFDETLKTEELGTFSIQHCVREEIEGYNFHNNNVSFGGNHI